MSSKTSASAKVNLGMNTGNFRSGAASARRDTSLLSKTLNQLGIDAAAAGKAVGLGFTAAAAATGALALKLANDAKEITRSTKVLGFSSAESFQVYSKSAEKAGLSTEKFADQMKDFNEKLGEFKQTGGGGFADFFKLDGVKLSADDLIALPTEQRLQAVQDEMERLNVGAETQSFIWESIASDMTLMIPSLKNQGAEIKKNQSLLEDMGAILSNESIEGLNDFKTNLADQGAAIQGLGNIFVSQFIPALQSGSKAFADFLKNSEGLRNVAAFLGQVVSAGMTALTTAFNNLGFAAIAFSGILIGRVVPSLTAIVAGMVTTVTTTSLMEAQFIAGAAAARLKTVAMTGLARAYTMLGGPVGLAVSSLTLLTVWAYKSQQAVAAHREEMAKLPAAIDSADTSWSEFNSNRTKESAELAKAKQEELLSIQKIALEEARRNYTQAQSAADNIGSDMHKTIAARLKSQFDEVNNAVAITEMKIWDAKNAVDSAADSAGILNENQAKILGELDKQNAATQQKLALDAVAAKYGQDSLQFAMAEAQAKRDAAIAAANKAVADANGKAEVQAAADEAIRLADATYSAEMAAAGLLGPLQDAASATYDATSGAWQFEGAMWGVHAAVAAVAGILNQLGAGITNAGKAQELALIRSGVDPLKARVQVERKQALEAHDLKMENASGAEYAELMLERSQLVTGWNLDDDIASETEAYRDANRKGGGGGKGRSGGGGGKTKLSDEARRARKESDDQAKAYAELQERVALLGATLGKTALEQQIFSEKQKVGSHASGEAVEALVRQEDALKRLQDAIDQSRTAFVDAFKGIVTGTMSVKDAVGNILSSITDQFLDFAANQVFQWLLGAFFPGAGGAMAGASSVAGSVVGLPGFANGTNNFAGGLARINERGGEIVKLPGGSQVIPHDLSKRIADNQAQAKEDKAVGYFVGDGVERRILTKAQQNAASQIKQNDKGFNRRVSAFQADPRKRY